MTPFLNSFCDFCETFANSAFGCPIPIPIPIPFSGVLS